LAFYILIDKISESEREAFYRFYDTGYPDEVGELRLDKATGSIEMTKPSRDAFFSRAAVTVARHFRDGNLPESACWAS
jgi:hypothetical protein